MPAFQSILCVKVCKKISIPLRYKILICLIALILQRSSNDGLGLDQPG